MAIYTNVQREVVGWQRFSYTQGKNMFYPGQQIGDGYLTTYSLYYPERGGAQSGSGGCCISSPTPCIPQMGTKPNYPH